MPYPFDMTFNLNALGNAEGLYGGQQNQMGINPQQQIRQQQMNMMAMPLPIADNSNMIQAGNASNQQALGMIGAQQPNMLGQQGGMMGNKMKDAATNEGLKSLTGKDMAGLAKSGLAIFGL